MVALEWLREILVNPGKDRSFARFLEKWRLMGLSMLHLVPYSATTKKGPDDDLVVLFLDELYADVVRCLDEEHSLGVRIYALYTLYTLYSTQSELTGGGKRAIRLPEPLWNSLLKLKREVDELNSESDPADLLALMLEKNMFLFTAAPRY